MHYPARKKYVLALVVLSSLILAILAWADQPGKPGQANPHAEGKISTPAGSSEVAYCSSCHKSGCSVPHPELVKVSWPTKGRVVLGVQGEVTCGSCHTPGFRKRSVAFLARDQKGLYSGARAGRIPNVAGIDIPFSPPANADMVLRNDGDVAQIDTMVSAMLDRVKPRLKVRH